MIEPDGRQHREYYYGYDETTVDRSLKLLARDHPRTRVVALDCFPAPPNTLHLGHG